MNLKIMQKFVPLMMNTALQITRVETVSSYRSGTDWRKLPIKECNERLVKIPGFLAYPYYARHMNIGADTTMYLREGVLDKVLAAQKFIKELFSLDLMVYDAWRSYEVQEELFYLYLKKFTLQNFRQDIQDAFAAAETTRDIKAIFDLLLPEIQDELIKANRRYVSWPSREKEKPAPHATGGAVDVWLHYGNQAIDLGVPFDHMEKNAGAFYHLKFFRKRFAKEKLVTQARSAMLFAMLCLKDSGFSAYPPEFWHFNYGNQMDSLVTKEVAKYGYIEP